MNLPNDGIHNNNEGQCLYCSRWGLIGDLHHLGIHDIDGEPSDEWCCESCMWEFHGGYDDRPNESDDYPYFPNEDDDVEVPF